MNFLCSSDPENEFLEAMNTLEREKIKEKENISINKPNIFMNNKNPNNILIEKETLENKNNLNYFNNISSKHEKKSSILEIIEYPYMDNNTNHLKKNSKLNSDLTDINCETQLFMEYTKSYKYTINKGDFINYNDNKVENNNKFINYNLKNRNNINKKEEKNNENNSNNSLIINNDYNVSIISNISGFNLNDKNSNNNTQHLNNELEKNDKASIKKNNNYINIKHNPNDKRKTDNNRKHSIPFPKNRYSNDTNFTKEINLNSDKLNTAKNIHHKKKKMKEIPKIKKEEKSDKNNNIINNNKTVNKNNKINQKPLLKKKKLKLNNNSNKQIKVKNNKINKQKTNSKNNAIQKNENSLNNNKQRNIFKPIPKNGKKKNNYSKNYPINKNTNINLFIITNTRNIFEQNKFSFVKKNIIKKYNLNSI